MAGSPACKGAGQLSAAAGLTLLCDVTRRAGHDLRESIDAVATRLVGGHLGVTLDAALAPFKDQPVRLLEVPVSAARFRNQRCYVMALYARGAIADSPRTLEYFSRNARSDPLYRLVQFMQYCPSGSAAHYDTWTKPHPFEPRLAVHARHSRELPDGVEPWNRPVGRIHHLAGQINLDPAVTLPCEREKSNGIEGSLLESSAAESGWESFAPHTGGSRDRSAQSRCHRPCRRVRYNA